jgi:hypothetical protein
VSKLWRTGVLWLSQRMIERAVRLAQLVEASADDNAWLCRGQAPADVARHRLQLGASVVITSSADGADASPRTDTERNGVRAAVEVRGLVGKVEDLRKKLVV